MDKYPSTWCGFRLLVDMPWNPRLTKGTIVEAMELAPTFYSDAVVCVPGYPPHPCTDHPQRTMNHMGCGDPVGFYVQWKYLEPLTPAAKTMMEIPRG